MSVAPVSVPDVPVPPVPKVQVPPLPNVLPSN
jgi:hypothetical protein